MKKIIVLTAVFAMVFTGAALAADWNFYGHSRMSLFSNTYSKDISSTGVDATAAYKNPLSGSEDWTTTTFGQQGNSRIGAKVAAGDVSGQFEYGTGVNVRLLYGSWNFGSGVMSVGRMWTPTFYGLSNSVYDGDNALAYFGGPWSRYPQIQFAFGGFKIAFVEPSTAGAYDPSVSMNASAAAAAGKANGYTFNSVKGTLDPIGYVPMASNGYKNARVTLPKIEIAYNGAFGPVKMHASAGWNSVEFVNSTNTGETLTSMLGQVMAKYNAGPFMVGGSFSYGINQGNYQPAYGPAGVAEAIFYNGKFKDTTSMGFTVIAGFTINDMLGVEAGYGYNVNSYDSDIKDSSGNAVKDDVAMQYYVQLPITLADGVFIIPEVGKMDFDEDATGAKEGDITYLGAKFQINF
jgi:hypothetical protein